jgi:uncharacterized protein YegJ (DUF2314 family)
VIELLLRQPETVGIIASDVASLISPLNGFRPFERIFKFHPLPRPFEPGLELSARGELMRHRIGSASSVRGRFTVCLNDATVPAMRFFLFPLAALILLSCEAAGRQVLRWFPSGGPSSDPTFHLDRDNPELRRIAEEARDTLPVFIRRLQSPLEGDGNFRIKCPLETGKGGAFGREQLWLENIGFRNGAYHGTLANVPFYVPALKAGDIVTFEIDDITDWMYTRHGTIVGGRSIKYLLDQIPEHERDDEQRAVLAMFESQAP